MTQRALWRSAGLKSMQVQRCSAGSHPSHRQNSKSAPAQGQHRDQQTDNQVTVMCQVPQGVAHPERVTRQADLTESVAMHDRSKRKDEGPTDRHRLIRPWRTPAFAADDVQLHETINNTLIHG